MPLTPRLLLAVAVLATGVALVDANREGNSDLVPVLAAVLVLTVAAAAAAFRARGAVQLRPDLATWLRRQAEATGEPVERLADRCVAAYRAGLTDEPPTRSAVDPVTVETPGSR